MERPVPEPFPQTFKDFIGQEWHVVSDRRVIPQPNGESYFTRIIQLSTDRNFLSEQRESTILKWASAQEGQNGGEV